MPLSNLRVILCLLFGIDLLCNLYLSVILHPLIFFFGENVDAGKELKKLRGEAVTEPAKNQQVTGRKRRLGILGYV